MSAEFRLADVAVALMAIALLLWAGHGVRANVHFLRNLFLPVSVIAGTLGLLLGPQVFGPLLTRLTPWPGGPIPGASYAVWSSLPGLLISVVFAALFLGKPLPGMREVWRSSGPQLFLGYAISLGQYTSGLLLAMLVLTPFFGTDPLAGVLLEIAMTGGHGTAAGLGDTFEALGFAEGRDLALALATVGLVGGVLLGTLFVNIAMRRAPHALPAPLPIVLDEPGIAPAHPDGPASGQAGGVEALSLQIGLIGAAIVIGMLLQTVLVQAERLLWVQWSGPLMAYVPLFPLAMIGGVLLQLALTAMGRAHWVNDRLVGRLSGTALDFIIVSALATLSLSVIGDQFWPFILLAMTGLAWATFCLLVLAPRFIPQHWFARGVGDFGQGTGMVVSGLLLMRMADPEGRSGNLERFGYKQLLFEPVVGGGLLTAMALPLAAQFGSLTIFAWSAGLTLLTILGGLRLGRSLRSGGAPV
ncbi:sodium/glutamate symporter [Hydrogenophaga sp.]|uniref:sodium/glutamate symporter n=1 Tax=Hydrogenophaga sp. TaxID=1904254 RepID=UPI002731EBF6|nr:sodium/glutamate symporter [Hydrogenophaga sp.]MDP2076241.1 sodium/glutamate symporter [Hydrogenophaga sp.]MDP3109499.1 sodium/glutamate symporter [Hydrogenophaga sp.]